MYVNIKMLTFPYEEDYKPYSYKREKRQREYPKEYSRYM